MAENTFNFDQMLSNAREAYGEELYKMACEGYDFVFTYSDNVALSASAGKLIKEFPERTINFGIAEPDQVGASCGLALSGCKVYSQVFGPFLPLRAADQIHTDIAYNDVNVTLIGTHAGATAEGGPTHNNVCDLALYRAIPNLTVAVPADAGQCVKYIRKSFDYDKPMIIRIDRGGSPAVYMDQDYELEIGKAIETAPGDDMAFIACGSSVYWAWAAAQILKEKDGINARVIDMHCYKPMDTEIVRKAAMETGCIVTVEEASINGGLGGAVAEFLMEEGLGVKFGRSALPDKFLVLGHLDDIYKYYGIDPEGIAETARKVLGKKPQLYVK